MEADAGLRLKELRVDGGATDSAETDDDDTDAKWTVWHCTLLSLARLIPPGTIAEPEGGDCSRSDIALTAAAGYRGTVDFASGAPVSVNAVVETMARVLGVPVVVGHEGHTEEYIEFRTVDRTMRERFAIVPSISFEDGVRRLHAHLLKDTSAGQPA